jgi:hypothetical protein
MHYRIQITMISILMVVLGLQAEVDKTALLITQVKNDLSYYIPRLQKVGYTLEAIPYTLNTSIRNRLSNASTDEVVAFVNALQNEDVQWKPLIKPTMSFLLNKKLIQDFGLRQRFAFWLGVKNVDNETAEQIAQKRKLNAALYAQLKEQVAIRNRRQGHFLYTVADYLLILEKKGKTLKGVDRYDEDTGLLAAFGLAGSPQLKLNNLSLTSIEGLHLIEPAIAQTISRIDFSDNSIDTLVDNELTALPRLKWIYFNQNKLSTIAPSTLNGFIGVLNITHNPISIPNIEKLHSALPNMVISTCSRRRWKGEKCQWPSDQELKMKADLFRAKQIGE